MFRKVVQRFTNAATKPGCLGPFQRSLPQQESALPNAYESNDRNVTGLSYKKNTTKVQQLETFPTQYIGVSKFLFVRIPAGGSSGIVKLFPEGNVQFKKLGGIARLDPALCHSESQPVGFGANQQAVKNILAKGEKSDILSGTWGLMQNPIGHSFREGEMHTNEQYVENSQEEQLQGKNELESQIKEPNDQATKPTEGENQLDKDLNSAKQSLNEKDKELKSEDEKLKGKIQQLEGLKSQNEELKDENKELKTKLQEFENVQAKLANEEEKISELNGQVIKLIEEKNQLEENLNSIKQSLNEKDKELKSKDEELKNETQQLKAFEGENSNLKIKLQESENKIQELEAFKGENEKLKGQNQQLEELKSTNEGKIQQLESQVKELETLKSAYKSAYESQVKNLQKQLENKNKELEDNKDSKPSAVNARGVKINVNCAAASFILSWMYAVGAALSTPSFAASATFAAISSIFLALGCYCSYKANTALSNIEVDRPDNRRSDNRRLLESRL